MLKKTSAALLLTTALVASIAGTVTVLAADNSGNQIPGYDRSGQTVPIPNPDRN
jgi:hypothetical protein